MNENKSLGSASSGKKGNADTPQLQISSTETGSNEVVGNDEWPHGQTAEPEISDAAPLGAPEMSFADRLYDEITSVIGGDDPNQFFCMGLPGTLIDPEEYAYAIDKNEPKPAFVEANESKLVNKLFDACKMTASDNGRHLQTQYKAALDVLMPKLNRKLFEAKTKLRKVLMTPYPYNFGGDLPTTGLTLQQVFYKLYNEYVAEKQKWAQMQIEKKNELAKKYSGGTAEENRIIQHEYLDWYETTAESYVLNVEEKLGNVLDVFSPGDMEIITGILDSGAGREIAEARQALTNVAKLNPDGGHVYPVALYPENWFTLLDKSFTPIDLLESPAALSQKMSVLIAQRSNLTTQINTLTTVIPDNEDVAALEKAYKEADNAYDNAFKTLSGTYLNVTIDMLKTFVDVVGSISSKGDPVYVLQETTARIFGIDASNVTDLLGKLGDSAKKCIDAQKNLNDAAKAATSAAMTYFKSKNLLQYKTMLGPLQTQLQNTNDKIAELRQKIAIATIVQKKSGEGENRVGDVIPNFVPDNFTQILITSSMSEVYRQSSSSDTASQSEFDVSFFFGGYSSNNSHADAATKTFANDSSMEIQVGMSLAKVRIGREWFNPGVFLLSTDMYNTSSKQIAPINEYKEFSQERFDAMNKCIFPCFPTSFVIARDVTIKFTASSAISNSFAQTVEDHSASGGGFFIFGGSSSSSSSSSESSSKATSTSKSVTVRFTAPQILGYYLQATTPDKSSSLSDTESRGSSDFISIFNFINELQEMLDEHNKTYKK